MVATLEVIWIDDALIRPPGPKMVVCACAQAGLFLHINTRGWRKGSIPIAAAQHGFLKWDSHIECGATFELDDYLIEQSLRRRGGIIGRIDRRHLPAMLAAIEQSDDIRENDKALMLLALRAA